MRNLDALKEAKQAIITEMQQAIAANDSAAFAAAYEKLSDNVQQRIMAQVEERIAAADAGVLTARGANTLTSAETRYYEAVITAMKSSDPRQALAGVDVAMPRTIIDRVFEDLRAEYPLLDVIDFQNTSGLTDVVIDTTGNVRAAWGALTATIVTELTGGLKALPANAAKLTAFLPIAKAYLDLGAAYLDQYVRTLLTESIYAGLEEGIVTGTGASMPIGMTRDVADDVTVTAGVYPEKTAVAVTEITPASYGALAAQLATVTHIVDGQTVTKTRSVGRLMLLVNPIDYLQVVGPGTTVRAADGTYARDVLPLPTDIIQTGALPAGTAVLGIAKRYFMGIGTAKSGKIEYSDDYHFCEDERVYIAKLYGMGRPMDNGAFIKLDISSLTPAAIHIYDDAAQG